MAGQLFKLSFVSFNVKLSKSAQYNTLQCFQYRIVKLSKSSLQYFQFQIVKPSKSIQYKSLASKAANKVGSHFSLCRLHLLGIDHHHHRHHHHHHHHFSCFIIIINGFIIAEFSLVFILIITTTLTITMTFIINIIFIIITIPSSLSLNLIVRVMM